MTRDEKVAALDALRADVEKCRACRLFAGATHGVPGEGNPETSVFFIGEGPGKDEDLTGRPFVGRAGKFLSEMLASIDWSRDDVFIANVVKHRPPDNRDPAPDEAAACWPYLERQIQIIKPRLIVTLGRHSMARFLPNLTIGEAHGQPKRRADGQVFLPLYHPAAALYSPTTKAVHLADFAKIPLVLAQIKNNTSLRAY